VTRLGPRRVFLFLTLLLLALAPGAFAQARPAIVFVHGNGDSAALWQTIVWRFEANGYPATLLHAIDFTSPNARSDDTKPQDNRSSTDDALKQLAAKVAEVQARTGGGRVALVGSSRGGNAIRNYIRNGGGAAHVSHAVLSGATNHGVWADAAVNPNSEFNGAGPFITGLNTPDEVYAGVKFMIIRSDSNDKYAQPDGRFIGRPGQPTHVTFAGPELRGATNVVLPGLDHREVAFHPLAFKTMYAFITGAAPATLEIAPQPRPILNGVVSGYISRAATNIGLAGATVEVYEVDPATGQRKGGPVHQRTTGADGAWGPFPATPTAYYELVVTAAGYPTTHVYRTPFPRSSAYVHLRLQPLDPADRAAGSVVRLSRPRGYLGHGRDTFTIDGAVPGGVNEGVPGASEAKATFDAPGRAVRVVINAETLTVITRPPDHVVIAEAHY
jgi:triacylglycerol lipase